ncbi:predicted protein [Nematostella vectensis]|uniref:Uncharacterized protein n=1 Tax=Nematostella vectensis TaxID=45351 RepID=A7RI90_NEMVE|nr:predicted protein [Nematostella vectensis]|eukprot:XP_001640723.1 predicted protein [Nematostella vectensis]
MSRAHQEQNLANKETVFWVIFNIDAILKMTQKTLGTRLKHLKSPRTLRFRLSPELSQLKAVGCYKDNEDERALRIPYHNHRRQIDWSKYPDFTEVIRACAKEAYEKGFTSMFGVQFYGECWSDEQAAARFNMHRMSTDCDHGVGKKFTNFIYGICTAISTHKKITLPGI